MKKFLSTLGVVVFIPIFFASCKKDVGTGGHNDPPVNNNVAAKISSVSVSPSASIVLNGMNPSTKVTINASATGNPAPNITINNVTGSQYTSPDLFESTSFNVVAYNSVGQDASSANVTVTVDPLYAKLAGTTMAGRSFHMITATSQPIGGGTITDMMNPCLADDVFMFFPNCTQQVNHGNSAGCITGLSLVYKNQFNASDPNNMLLKFIDVIPAQPDRKVEFPSSNTMVHTYDYNGLHIIQTFQAL